MPKFDSVHAIDIGLFIGNNNQKGRAAVFSALKNLTRPVTFIEGGKPREVAFWSEPANYAYPDPIGTVRSYAFASPDPFVFSARHRFKHLSVRVGFEWRLARWSFSLFRRLTEIGLYGAVEKFVGLCFPFFLLAHRIGSERGAVSVTVTGMSQGEPAIWRASVYGAKKGQRMASLPAVIAAETLARGEITRNGLLHPADWIPPEIFLSRLEAKGFQTVIEEIL